MNNIVVVDLGRGSRELVDSVLWNLVGSSPADHNLGFAVHARQVRRFALGLPDISRLALRLFTLETQERDMHLARESSYPVFGS